MIGGQPCEKKGRKQRTGHDLQSMHARVAKEPAPSCRVRNRASDAANSFRPEKINNEFQWLKTFKNEKKKENDAESEKRVNVEERHRGVERELDPEGQRPPSLRRVGQPSGVIRLRRGSGGQADPGYSSLAKE